VVVATFNGVKVRALVDTGCSQSIVSSRLVGSIPTEKQENTVITMSGDSVKCDRVVDATVCVGQKELKLTCIVTPRLLDRYQLLLGIDAVAQAGDVLFKKGKVSFCNVAKVNQAVVLEDKDYRANFNGKRWSVSWNWKDHEPETLQNRVGCYKVDANAKKEFEEEVLEWIRLGWLQPFSGTVKGLLPLMAVVQVNKNKVRPVLDYRELNGYVSSHTAESVVCAESIRSWRQMGDNISIVDLRKAYLQIHVSKDLWPYQIVRFQGKTYCLTRLGFGLNVAPKVMTAIVTKVLSLDDDIKRATSSYIDDIIVNENIVSSERVREHLLRFGLEAKPPESIVGSRVLGLRVEARESNLYWCRGNDLPSCNDKVTKRELFSWAGRMIGHYPVGGWLRVACSYIKRNANQDGWELLIDDDCVLMMKEVEESLKRSDPVGGVWTVKPGEEATVWCDASSLAVGAVIEISGEVVEDMSWLRPKDDGAHINVAELDAVLKGLNMCLHWKRSKITIMTDSSSVHKWVQSVISADRRIKVKGISEALIRRRLCMIRDIMDEYKLKLDIHLVSSANNLADRLTRVPERWLRRMKKCLVGVVALTEAPLTLDDIRASHERHHLGVDRTMAIIKHENPERIVDYKLVQRVVRDCRPCCSIDPAPIRWDKGHLSVARSWSRVAVDVTHYKGERFFTFIDCGPSRFTIWRLIPNESAAVLTSTLLSVFREFGSPEEILLDNFSTFRSREIKEMCDEWNVKQVFRCANRPSGNGVVERIHRTVKRMAGRSGRSPLAMVYFYNISPRVAHKMDSSPYYLFFDRQPYVCRVDRQRGVLHDFKVGERVYVKPMNAPCHLPWPIGRVTNSGEGVAVEVDGVQRHVSDLRKVPIEAVPQSEVDGVADFDFLTEGVVTDENSVSDESVDRSPTVRRGGRIRTQPRWMHDYDCSRDDV